MQRRSLKTLLSIILVILMTILLHYAQLLLPLESLFQKILQPTSSAIFSWSTKIGSNEEHFESVEDLQMAYTNAKRKMISEAIDQARLDTLMQENETLKKQMNFFTTHNNISYVNAHVIGKNIDPIGKTLIIDTGNESGIMVGDPVIFDNGILIGKIIQIEKNTAILRLLNDNQSKIAATVLNNEKSIGIIEGGFGISVRMTFIPQNERVEIGDIIVTSGLESEIPYGLFIGTIASMEKEVYEPFQSGAVTVPHNLEKVRIVSVLMQR